MPNDVAGLVSLLLDILTFAILVRFILSFIDPHLRSPIGSIIRDLTEPIIDPIRRMVPPIGMIDLSPMIAILLIQVLNILLQRALHA